MKKTVFALFALLAVFACNRNEVDFQNPDWEKDNTPMSFSLSVNAIGGGAETKAALKAGWSDGDVVYIFFDALPTKYVKKTFDGSDWSEEYPGGALVAGDFSADGPVASRNMTAVWFPQGEVTVTYADEKFSFTIGGEKIYSHYMSVHAGYIISGTTVTGDLDLEKPAGFVQFFVPGIVAADAPAYRLMESHLTPKACDFVALGGGVTEAALTAGYSLKGIAFTTDGSVTGALFGGYLSTAGDITSYKFSLVKGISATIPAAEGTYTLVGFKNIAAGISMTFPAYGDAAWGTMSPFVYLGFGDIQWATGNLKDDGSIVSPLDAGDYYRWGAIKKYGESGDESYWVNEDLPASRDIAALRSSNNWHMPSQSQFDALTNDANTTRAWYPNWTTLGSSKGGYLVTSKVNGLSLFFAAAGLNVSDQLGDYGYCWSSTPDASGAYVFSFGHDVAPSTGNVSRGLAIPVRPITGAPTPAPPYTDISTLSTNHTAVDGETLYGTLVNNVKISIADGATVTLDGITINGVNNDTYEWAGLTCLGDATIILKDGTMSNVKGFYLGFPGINVPLGSTLTIKGTGSLNASSHGYGAGIGGESNTPSGNIDIQGGIITATGGSWAAGIGGGYGYNAICGDISISGGTITAIGGQGGAGIGCGKGNEGDESMTACGDISISGGTITATGGANAAGIGSGSYASCGNITITTGVTSVTATKGDEFAPNSVGLGVYAGTCGTVTIGGVETGPITSSPYYYPAILSQATAEDVGKVVCAAGHLHNAKTAVPAGCTAVGILGKVAPSTGHGLILALKDATSQTWNTINGWSSASYAGTSLKVLPDDAARGSLTSYTILGTTPVSNWAVADMFDYNSIFYNLHSTIDDGYGYTYDDNVNSYITTGVGGDALSNDTWSTSQGAGGGIYAPAYSFHSGGWSPSDKSYTKSIRPVLGF